MKIKFNCPVCNNNDTIFYNVAHNIHGNKLINAEESFRYRKCNTCTAIFIEDIIMDTSYYETYYATTYHVKRSDLLITFEKILTNFSIWYKEKIIVDQCKNKKGKIKILDVGSGEGRFLEGLDSKKFIKYGLELDKESVKNTQRMGLNVLLGDILKTKFNKEKFGVITLWHVIEHINKPQELFQKLSTILEPNGIVIVSTPNTDSLGFQRADIKWFHFDAPRHVILYNRKSIEILVKKHNFKINKKYSEHFEFPLDLYWSFHTPVIKLLVLPFYILIKLFDQETFTMIFQKKE